MIRNLSLVGALVALLAAGALAVPAVASDSPTRAEYVRAVEPICFQDARTNARILRGTREMVNRGQYRAASQRFARAARAFTGTLRQILQVPRPEADREQLQRWIGHLLRQRTLLVQMSRTLARENRRQAQRLSMQLMRNANQANMVVGGYGFRHCQIRPGMFL